MLPFNDAGFDLIFNNNMLGVVPEEVGRDVVREMFRVLRPAGHVVLVMMSVPSRGFGTLVYEIGAVRLGGWRSADVAPLLRASGFIAIEQTVVTQIGIPSTIIEAHRPGC